MGANLSGQLIVVHMSVFWKKDPVNNNKHIQRSLYKAQLFKLTTPAFAQEFHGLSM